jgi:hypothetical protein
MNENIEITILIFLYSAIVIAGIKLLMFILKKIED